jgi:hypothetical protein
MAAMKYKRHTASAVSLAKHRQRAVTLTVASGETLYMSAEDATRLEGP